jgi:hypothetical protein
MAIFNKNEELARQQVRIAPEQAKGLKKAALAGLGYKATGEQSGFGKVLGYIPGGQTTRHFMARAVAGKADKSDYAATLKAGDKDAVNKLVQDVKLGVEVAKVVGTGGAGGAAGAGGGAMSKAISGGGSDIAGKVMGGASGSDLISGGGIGGGKEGMDLFKGQATGKMGTAPNMDALKEFADAGGNVDDVETAKQLEANSEDNKLMDGKKMLDKIVTASEDNLQTNPTEGGKYDKAINTTDKIGDLGSNVPVVGGIIEAGAGSAAAGMSYNAALAKKTEEFQNKKKDLSDDSLYM